MVKPDPLAGDSFTKFLQKALIDPFHGLLSSCCRPPDLENGVYVYHGATNIRLANVVGTVIASLLPILAVVILYFRHSDEAWDGYFIHDVVFTFSDGHERSEIFAATAA